MDPFLAIPLMIVLLLLKGFFSGSEIALVNADKIKLRHAAKQGNRGAELAMKLLQKPEFLLSTTLVGTNISTIALTTVGTLMMISWFGQRGDLYAFLAFTPLFLVLGEIVPKSVYQQKTSVLTPIIIFPLSWSARLFYPVVFVFSRIARFCARLVGAGKTEQTLFITREQLRTLVDLAEQSAALSESNRGRIRRVIRFADTTVAEAMVPIAQVICLDCEKIGRKSTRTAVDLVRKHGFNRLPVFEQNTSNITGIVTMTTWDMLELHANEKPISDMIKPALYVAPNQTIDGLLPQLRQREDRMAIVVNEFGSAIGMITMEDIVEEVLGEIDVGYDFEEYQPKRRHEYSQIGDDSYIMDSRLSISEANEVLGIHLPATEFHTLGGLVMARLRRIPRNGDYIVELGYRLTVVEATERALLKLRVEPDADAAKLEEASQAQRSEHGDDAPGESNKNAEADRPIIDKEVAEKEETDMTKKPKKQATTSSNEHSPDKAIETVGADIKANVSKIPNKVYEKELAKLQIELVKLQEWVKSTGMKVVVLFEGRDAAGKGGTIKRITQSLNPRICRVVALGTPTEREKGQWYFQRYVPHLPAEGEIVLFDRSWYNRAGVERVMGFCTEEEYEEFMRTCPEFERMLIRSGIKLIKYWFSVSDEEQERRFQSRIVDPTKRWKLSPMDLESRRRWIEYSKAKDVMFAHTDIKQAPWYVVEADVKKRARLNCIRHFLSLIPYEDLTPDPIKLPPRTQDISYVRPPKDDQNLVPDSYDELRK